MNDDTQKIYDSVPTTEASFNLPRSDLDLKDKLGAGCFGSVLKGIYKHHGTNIPVAVKTLKLDDEAGKVRYAIGIRCYRTVHLYQCDISIGGIICSILWTMTELTTSTVIVLITYCW